MNDRLFPVPPSQRQPSVAFRPFIAELRKLGFRKSWESRADGIRTAEWRKDVGGGREIDLQLWGDGKHRVSHWIQGSMNTLPTEFTTVEEMRAAIERETTRTDNNRLAKASSL